MLEREKEGEPVEMTQRLYPETINITMLNESFIMLNSISKRENEYAN